MMPMLSATKGAETEPPMGVVTLVFFRDELEGTLQCRVLADWPSNPDDEIGTLIRKFLVDNGLRKEMDDAESGT